MPALTQREHDGFSKPHCMEVSIPGREYEWSHDKYLPSFLTTLRTACRCTRSAAHLVQHTSLPGEDDSQIPWYTLRIARFRQRYVLLCFSSYVEILRNPIAALSNWSFIRSISTTCKAGFPGRWISWIGEKHLDDTLRSVGGEDDISTVASNSFLAISPSL